jgi:aldehyde dehydrogenase (NAD+)
VLAKADVLTAVTVEEYGGAQGQVAWRATLSADSFLHAAQTLEDYEFTRRIGTAEVVMEPLGVVGIITPWNSNIGFICGKLAMAIAAGCTCVIKPSEMSALQTDALLDCLHEAGAPAGVFNLVNGRGDTVGSVLSSHPDIAKVSFTGSTAVGRAILRAGAESFKRVTLELGGKSPLIMLDDADFAATVPMAVMACFGNNGQACIAATRMLVPERRLDEVCALAKATAEAVKVGDPRDPSVLIGPLVSAKQYERVQRYIQLGLDEGARLVAGGLGRPDGLDRGYFVRPTVFADVSNSMTIAREEIFGPVLSILTYRTEEEAIEIANDTLYGLQAYIVSGDEARARRIAGRLEAGRVSINSAGHEPLAPFGGFKQSGIGREGGVFGLEAHLEPKSLLGLTLD